MSAPPEGLLAARTLVERARADLTAAETLAQHAAEVAEIVGFHCQQAVEKSLKAVLFLRGEGARHTHDLVFLLEAGESAGIAPPLTQGEAEALYPFAVEFRYEKVPEDGAPRTADMVRMARRVVEWAEAELIKVTPAP